MKKFLGLVILSLCALCAGFKMIGRVRRRKQAAGVPLNHSLLVDVTPEMRLQEERRRQQEAERQAQEEEERQRREEEERQQAEAAQAEMIAQLQDQRNTDEATARRHLEASGWRLQRAIRLLEDERVQEFLPECGGGLDVFGRAKRAARRRLQGVD